METILRVIIIEDSMIDAELILYGISKHYIVEHVLIDNASDLKRVLNESHWDLILCDFSMPGFNPYKAVNVLREYDLDIPLIVISGTIGEEQAIGLLKAGCCDCILKSNLSRLPGVIDRELNEAKIREENKALYKKLKKYQILADEASDIILFIDIKGSILDANLSAIKKYGYSYDELIDLEIFDLGQDNDKRYVESQMRSAEEMSILFETVHFRKDGSPFNVEVNLQKVLLDNKKILLSVIRDSTERKTIEVKLKQNIKDLWESQRIAHIGTWRLDLATNQVVWSEELYKMYGFDPTIPPPPYTEHMKLFTTESWEKLSTALEYTSKSGVPYELELKTVTKDGSNGWLWARGEAETDSEGKVIAIWGAAQDITGHKKTESAIKQSEQKFQLLFDEAPLGYQSLDFEGHFIEVNQKWLDTLGYNKEEVIGKWFGDFLCPEYVDGFRKRFPIFKSQGYIHSEFEMISKDGHRLYLAFDGKIGYGADGEFKQTHCILQDITNQKKAEKALIESEERYKYLFEHSGVGIGYYTTDGVVVSYNQRALENLGGKIEDYVGKSISALFPTETAELLYTRIEKAISSEQLQEYEDYLILNSGPKWFSSTFTRVLNSTGDVIGVQIASLDITVRKYQESDLLYLSYHDHLTGLFNRRYFEKALKQLDIETNLPLSIIICDINGLKLINDSFGHDYGDQLLVKATETIQESCRVDNIISRIGGDEFAILLPKTNAEEAAQVSAKIKSLAKQKSVENIELSISYGYDTKSTDKQDIVEVLANAENHMYRHKLYERSGTRSKTIDIIMNTLFEKSDRESMHSSRVSSICMAIATELNFDKDDVNKMGIAGLVHDIGKIGIDEKILNKPGRLSDDEREQINRHPEVGWRILSSANEFSELAQFILDHHEKWDGSGYPNGLKGEEIPLEARIINIADSYDAMTSDRSYRMGMSEEEAIKELQRCSGSQFDPKIIDVFLKYILQNDNIGENK